MTLSNFLRHERRGVAAVEFAVFAQVFVLLFAATADVGVILFKRLQMNTLVAAAANYALISQKNVSSSGGADLATALASIATGSGTGTTAVTNTVITVNNGPTRSITAGVATTGGTAANADRCYCPTGTTTINWGSGVSCGAACASSLTAGKFVQITVTRTHTPLFSGYGIVHSGSISVTTLVQTG